MNFLFLSKTVKAYNSSICICVFVNVNIIVGGKASDYRMLIKEDLQCYTPLHLQAFKALYDQIPNIQYSEHRNEVFTHETRSQMCRIIKLNQLLKFGHDFTNSKVEIYY